MAAQNKLFQRLIWLADTVYSAKWLPADDEIIEELKTLKQWNKG